MAVISIVYDEGNKKNLGYESVELSYENIQKRKFFNSGDFVKDWYDCIKFIIINELNEPILHSSSVDHFIMDGAKFDSAYLHTNNGIELKYDNSSYENGIELFVDENTQPTWEELKLRCK